MDEQKERKNIYLIDKIAREASRRGAILSYKNHEQKRVTLFDHDFEHNFILVCI